MRPDDDLSANLERAMLPAPRTPPAERIRALRAHVEEGEPLRGPRRLARWLAAAAIVIAFGGGVVLGHDLPDPIRDFARAIGLPVESSTLVETRAVLHDLGVAISERDREAARAADARMLALVAQLNEEEKAKIVPVAHEVHERALELIEGQNDDPLTCPPTCP